MVRATAATIEAIRAAREAEIDNQTWQEAAATRSASRWGRNRKHSVPSTGEERANKKEAEESKREAALKLFASL